MDSVEGRKQKFLIVAALKSVESIKMCFSSEVQNLFFCSPQSFALIRKFPLRWMRAWHPLVWTWFGLPGVISVTVTQRPAKDHRAMAVSHGERLHMMSASWGPLRASSSMSPELSFRLIHNFTSYPEHTQDRWTRPTLRAIGVTASQIRCRCMNGTTWVTKDEA